MMLCFWTLDVLLALPALYWLFYVLRAIPSRSSVDNGTFTIQIRFCLTTFFNDPFAYH